MKHETVISVENKKESAQHMVKIATVVNHFASQCRQNKTSGRGRRSNNIRQLNTNTSDESDSEFEIMTVDTHDVNMIQNKIYAKMLLINESMQVKFQLDSDATANLIPKSAY